MYKYYISYKFSKGYGCSETWTNKKIKTWEHIQAIAEKIEKEKDVTDICIDNIILLKRTWGKCK